MTHEDLRQIWQLLRCQHKRLSFARDYQLIRLLVLVVEDIEERLERYSLAAPSRQSSPSSSISDGLLGVYCWIQASVIHMQTMAEREAELTKKANRERL